MRTADATGAHGIIIRKEELWDLQLQLRKHLPGQLNIFLLRVTNLSRTIDELKERGLWIAGTDAKGKRITVI